MLGYIITAILVIVLIAEVRSSRVAILAYKKKMQDGLSFAIVQSKKVDKKFNAMFASTLETFSLIGDDMTELKKEIRPTKIVKAKVIKSKKVIKTNKKTVKKSK